jgi:hypothetical protein
MTRGMRHVLGVLRGNHHVLHLHGFVVFVPNGDLRFGVRPQPADDPRLADFGQFAPEAMRVHDRRRHHLRRFVAGITEHQALVAGALLGRLLAVRRARVDALGNVGRLPREVIVDENLVGVKHVIFVHVPDLADGGPHDLVVGHLGAGGDLAGDHHHIGFHQRLARHAAGGILLQAGIEHAVGNQVGHLVRVALAHRFGGEDKGVCHSCRDAKPVRPVAQGKYHHIRI